MIDQCLSLRLSGKFDELPQVMQHIQTAFQLFLLSLSTGQNVARDTRASQH